MSATFCQLKAHYDRPIHTRRIRENGTVEGPRIETHYVITEGISIREGDDWLTVTMDYKDIELETRIPLESLRRFLGHANGATDGSDNG